MRYRFVTLLGVSLALHVGGAQILVRGRGGEELERTIPAPVLTGDTVEMPGLEAQAIAENEPDDQATREAVDLDQDGVMPKPPPTRTPRKPKTVVHGAVATTGESEGSDGEPVRFGAVGERGAVDLATAFTRGFPQAASADPIWARAPFGPTGSIDVLLTLDGTGNLVEARLEPGGSPALRQALSRTLALVRGRTFTARRETTRLRVTGHVSADAVRNGAFGDVFAIGGSFSGRSGSAFFSLAIGRKIEVTVTER